MKKDVLASLLNMFGILSLWLFIKSKIQCDTIYITAYHKVIDITNYDEYPYDLELVSANSNSFYKQVKYTKNYFDIKTFKTIHTSHKKPRLIITFDDGHKDNYETVFPILKKMKSTAVFFISTDYIDTNKLFWFELVVYKILNGLTGKYNINDSISILLTESRKEREPIAYGILKTLKKVCNEERISIVQKIEEIPVNEKLINTKYRAKVGNMTWSQIKEMSKHGMEIGSHGTTHAILARLSDQELKNEVYKSKEIIEEKIGDKVISIAYPVGGATDIDARVIRYTREAEYNYGVTYNSGVNRTTNKGDSDISRLHIERYTSLSRYKAMLAFPRIFA